ncbi:MAG: serine/threonine protein kinase/tetratricopeptide (TPR) repeat protein [Phycisphaerales bacterium]|jgi:serine/threonine protein kinase/tetratricopeptide (TPR) repeat protein
MTDPDTQRALFDRAMERPEAERDSFIRAQAGDDRGLAERVLLMFTDADAATIPPVAGPAEVRAKAPDRIGPYRVLGVLGEGGMGVVYRAEQDNPKREVALKLVRAGFTSERHLHRFELEAEVLGRLTHPGIAQIYEAGIDPATGTPFFAMELVDGVELNSHALGHRLSVRDRLALFVRICHAVQHAHAKGVIHRDLKPSNILVTDSQSSTSTLHAGPQPKVLDFGVARLTDSDAEAATLLTDAGQLVGTVPYMSPEQVTGDLESMDTRSDIYSLGVVLYELLSGRLPYDLTGKPIHEAARVITDTSAARLSSIDSHLKGDIETIVGKALEKDRDRRYQSASDFAADIERFLSNHPISARPPSAAYQLRMFTRRNRVLVSGVAATFVVLVAGILATTAFAVVADQRRVRAETAETAERERSAQLVLAVDRAESAEAEERDRAAQLELVASFQAKQLSEIDTVMMGVQLRQSLLAAVPEGRKDQFAQELAGINFTGIALGTLETNIFERAISTIDEQFADQPVVQAQLLQSVAGTVRELGLFELATDPQERAVAIRREHLGNDHPDTLGSINAMGKLLHQKGLYPQAEPFIREALDAQRRTLGDTHPDTLDSISALGDVLLYQFKVADAEAYVLEALAGYRETIGDDHTETIDAISSMGGLRFMLGKFDEAEMYFTEALEISTRAFGESHPATLNAQNNLGSLFKVQGKHDQAERYAMKSLEGTRLAYGNNHIATLSAVFGLGEILREQGKLTRAEACYREALAGQRQVLGDTHPTTLSTINSMGLLLQRQGDLAGAERFMRESMIGHQRTFGDDNLKTLVVLGNLCSLLHDLGKLEESESIGGEAVRRARASLPEGQWNIGTLLAYHARTLAKMGRFAQSESESLESHTILLATLGAEHIRTTQAVDQIVALYSAWDAAEPGTGHDDQAEQWGARLESPGTEPATEGTASPGG